MGYASTRVCHPTAEAAAADTCSSLVFAYSDGVGACIGSAVVDAEATYTINYQPASAASFTSTLEQTLQPCAELAVQDGIAVAWMILAAVIAAGAVLTLTRAVR